MTKLEAINKIRKLPTLKKGYEYVVYHDGEVTIFNKKGIRKSVLYSHFSQVANNMCRYDMEKYIKYFSKPIYENGEIVGYE